MGMIQFLIFIVFPLALVAIGMWLLVEIPYLPLAGISALCVAMQASVYVCGAERGGAGGGGEVRTGGRLDRAGAFANSGIGAGDAMNQKAKP